VNDENLKNFFRIRRKVDREGGALPFLADHFNTPAVVFHHSLDHEQPDAGPFHVAMKAFVNGKELGYLLRA